MSHIAHILRLLLAAALCLTVGALAAAATPTLPRLLAKVPAAELVPGADAYGPPRTDVPVAPILKGGERIGWVWANSDFVGATGYSGKPIHVLAAIDDDARVLGARLVEHSEPIVLVGIPEAKIRALTESYVGVDLTEEAATGGEAHDLDIISGATVTVIVIDDSLIRSGLKVARALGLGGLAPARGDSPLHVIDESAAAPADWEQAVGDGTVRRLSLDLGQINRAFEADGDPRAVARPEKGPETASFIDMETALVSVPAIGRALLGPQEYANLQSWLAPGDHAILVLGRGRYSFKGSGYVRGGIFDRIAVIQGEDSIRFRDRMHKRLGRIAIPGAPSFTEADLFRIPAETGFDPAEPWRLQLLVQRRVGAIDKAFTTFDLGYRLPPRYVRAVQPAPQPVAPSARAAAAAADQDERQAKAALWRRVWTQKTPEIAGLGAMLAVLTATFFFQRQVTVSEKVFTRFRLGFLAVTLIFLGWHANAQLSVVNLMALAASLGAGFSWDAFLMEPLTFILWFSVAAALLFWGRGAYCGWLCPFGALQELLNRAARALKVPQITLPWGLNERLWALKYMIFLGLFGMSLASTPWAERFAEVEPFKTAIILKFDRDWPYVLFALAMLAPGLFVERFYCRYVCPLGGGLAIPARLRMFDWLKRYPECGRPCQTCAHECPVQAIHPTGEINPNECVDCLHCQVLYQSDAKCPVVIRELKKRAKLAAMNRATADSLRQAIAKPSAQEGESR